MQIFLPYLLVHSKRTKSTRVLELVHTDICGPITPRSYNNKSYFISFVDDFSRFVIVYAKDMIVLGIMSKRYLQYLMRSCQI